MLLCASNAFTDDGLLKIKRGKANYITCGASVESVIRIRKEGVIDDIQLGVEGSIVLRAFCGAWKEGLKNFSLSDVKNTQKNILNFLDGKGGLLPHPNDQDFWSFLMKKAILPFPSQHFCAKLLWVSLIKALENES